MAGKDVMSELFSYISSDGEFITSDDIKSFYKVFDETSLNDKNVSKIIEKYDTNKDGKIDFNEFSVIDLKTDENIKESFYKYISNSKGDDFDYGKIKKLYNEYPPNVSLSTDKVSNVLRDIFDDNCDNKVSKKEFISNITSILNDSFK